MSKVTDRPWLSALLVLLIVFLSRIPFLGPGYGDDADAWRVAEAARQMWATGAFHSSRVPGHPLGDLIMALFYPLGPYGAAGASAVAASIAAALVFLWLKDAGVRAPFAPALGLAFMPAYFISSTTSLDFVWAFAFMMASLLWATRSRPLAAGLMLALAIGCRNTSGALLVPLSIIVATRPGATRRVRNILAMAAVAVAGGALLYWPVYRHYGFAYMIQVWQDPFPSWPIRLAYSAYELTGILGGVVLLVVLAGRCLGRGARRPEDVGRDRGLAAAALTGVGLYSISFLLLPHEGIYLLPAIPFVLFLMHDRLLSDRAMWMLSAGLALSSFLLSVEPVLQEDVQGPGRGIRFRIAKLELQFTWAGPVPANHASCVSGMAYVRAIQARMESLPRPAALVAGRWQPMLMNEMARGPQPGDLEILYLLDRDELASLQGRGVHLYCLPHQYERNLAMFNVDLFKEGVVLLDIPPLAPAHTTDSGG